MSRTYRKGKLKTDNPKTWNYTFSNPVWFEQRMEQEGVKTKEEFIAKMEKEIISDKYKVGAPKWFRNMYNRKYKRADRQLLNKELDDVNLLDRKKNIRWLWW